ncbi:hypothetical protein DI396_00035 [Litorivita pollutaquae]|uniref:Uncharacterized protein n=1 Tax=Litorivita pollutaquae TaxID=2200892 RepID=A0A2V4NGS6_9RHOB|nr:hypothetical protein DI396_00035 [Litorivita pollutaquae]
MFCGPSRDQRHIGDVVPAAMPHSFEMLDTLSPNAPVSAHALAASSATKNGALPKATRRFNS